MVLGGSEIFKEAEQGRRWQPLSAAKFICVFRASVALAGLPDLYRSAENQRRAFLILAAIHAERVSSPRSASSLSHSSGGRLMLDVVTVRPVGFRPAPSREPPLVGFFFIGYFTAGVSLIDCAPVPHIWSLA
jgi:hypothetical protein